MEGNESIENIEKKPKFDCGEVTMILPCPCCKKPIGLYPINREQSYFSVASHCPCKRGLNGGIIIIKDLCGHGIEYFENGKFRGFFNRLEGQWTGWTDSN